ncbi:MAG: lycopene cyclase family protein, partial [Pseudomonadota bacterium]
MSDGVVNTELAMDSAPHVATTDADVLMVGGSLTNCLTALWMAREKPDILIGIVEDAASLLSHSQWVFFDQTISPGQYRRLLPFISHRWDGYHARSMSRAATKSNPVSLLSGQRIAAAIEASPRIETLVSSNVTAVERDAIELSGDELVSAPLVLDARPVHEHRSMRSAYRHMCEFELKCTKPHEMEWPVLLDTALDQSGGFRFLQCLPLSPTHVIVTFVAIGLDETLDKEAAKGNLSERKAMVAKKGIMRAEDYLAYMGDSDAGQLGLLTYHTTPIILSDIIITDPTIANNTF